jgi:urease accessory protein
MPRHALLRLLQLADSVLPIGGAAHSFGLESLAAGGAVSASTLESFLRVRIAESLALEAAFCRAAALDSGQGLDRLNRQLSARMPAREPRSASLALGRRFWSLFASLYGSPLPVADAAAMHHSVAFGSAAGLLTIDPSDATLAWLQQAVTTAVSAATRLLPLGQSAAQALVWHLAGDISAAAERVRDTELSEVACFTPALDIACMTHPALETRLFIS